MPKKYCPVIAIVALAFTTLPVACGQAPMPPVAHALSDANQAPGVAGFQALIGNPQWAAQIQPVRVRVPDDAQVQIWNGAAFVPGHHPEPVVGLAVGPVARFEVNFQRPTGPLAVYPSIELINRLTPPAGLELRFPVEVVLTMDDLVQASEGRMVTRVVYLENPETALPFRQLAGEQAFLDISEEEDPLAVASRLGRPMAIVRLGSRIPSHDELDASFHFGGAPLQEFPQQFFENVEQLRLPAGSNTRQPDRSVRPVAWNQDEQPGSTPIKLTDDPAAVALPEIQLRDDNGFVIRDTYDPTGPTSYPQSICDPLMPGMTVPHYGMSGSPLPECGDPGCGVPGCGPQGCGAFQFSNPVSRDEYLFDGNDRNFEVLVDQHWKLYGLDTEDTVGHFDTLDGRRLVVPSNQVCIYSPRFASVRKIRDWNSRSGTAQLAHVRERNQMQLASGNDFSSTTLQQLMPGLNSGLDRASAVEDQTRGVLSDQVIHLTGFRAGFSPYENLQLIRFGKFAASETTRLELGMQSAGVWKINDGLQVIIDRDQPVIVNDVLGAQELVTVKVGDGKTLLRVCKVASKIAAEPGEEIEFTIRFDNVGQQLIGNVTIIDSLTPRLEYVANSTECSLKSDFLTERNEGQSLVLRWEITEPLKPNEGGIIRFRCRVR